TPGSNAFPNTSLTRNGSLTLTLGWHHPLRTVRIAPSRVTSRWRGNGARLRGLRLPVRGWLQSRRAGLLRCPYRPCVPGNGHCDPWLAVLFYGCRRCFVVFEDLRIAFLRPTGWCKEENGPKAKNRHRYPECFQEVHLRTPYSRNAKKPGFSGRGPQGALTSVD